MLTLTGNSLSIEQVIQVARHGEQVAPLDAEVITRMTASQQWIEDAVYRSDRVIYGVNTGFGPLARTRIAPEQARTLSRNLILNCLVGVGEPLPIEIVRAIMLIRINIFAQGRSGVRPLVAHTLTEMLNKGVTPHVPSKGSLGASGDLAPLAHIAVVFTRDETDDGGYSGQAYYNGELLTGAEAMRRAGIERLIPEPKEGLALTNGTTFMVAAGAIATYDAENLVRHAELAAALSIEALLGLTDAFHPALHEANRQPGQILTAQNLRALLADSRLVNSRPERVQDAYSLRCTPQVLGPIRDTLAFLRERFTLALNATSDNPLLVDNRAISGGNFHGQGPAMWLDFLSIAIAEAGDIAERRIFRLLTPELSDGLPSMLVPTSGLDSGLMMPQYTAAALVSDNKTLAHPDSVDSIPSSANQEDHVSMGANAARHALEILDNVRYIIAIEFLTAAQAIDLRLDGPQRLGRGTAPAHKIIRAHAALLTRDRETSPDIESLVKLIHSGELLSAIRSAVPEFV